jgi:hypothetical protein
LNEKREAFLKGETTVPRPDLPLCERHKQGRPCAWWKNAACGSEACNGIIAGTGQFIADHAREYEEQHADGYTP